MAATPPLDRPVTEFLSPTAFTLRQDLSIVEARSTLREGKGLPAGQVVCSYAVNEPGRLVGISPARQLILSPGTARVAEVMVREASGPVTLAMVDSVAIAPYLSAATLLLRR